MGGAFFWLQEELEGLSESDKKLIRDRIQLEMTTNREIKKIVRRKTKPLKDRLMKKVALPANVTTLKKA